MLTALRYSVSFLSPPRHEGRATSGLVKLSTVGEAYQMFHPAKNTAITKSTMPAQPKPLFNQVAEITLHYQSTVKPSQRPKVTCSSDAYTIFMNHWNPHQLELQEEFKVMLLNRAHKVLGIVNISLGGIAGTVADPKLIYAAALKAGSSALICAHNHPSGNLRMSQADLSLTQKLKAAGAFLDLPIQDHLIISAEGYYSFADEGVL